MNINNRIYFYKGKLPLPIIPLIVFALIVLVVLAILGLFIGAILGAVMIGFTVLRLFISSKKNQAKRAKEDDRTILLKEGDYEILEKKGKS